jgi:hypothetical protein
MRRRRGGITGRTAQCGISGRATTMAATTSSAPLTNAGRMPRSATTVGTPGSSTATAADGDLVLLRRGGGAFPAVLVPHAGVAPRECRCDVTGGARVRWHIRSPCPPLRSPRASGSRRAGSPAGPAGGRWSPVQAVISAEGSCRWRVAGAISAFAAWASCLRRVPSAARAAGAQALPAPGDPPRARAARHRAPRRDSWVWARPSARACDPWTKSTLA